MTTPDVLNGSVAAAASYSTEVEGGKPVRRHYVVRGRLTPATFLAFVAERAAWFGISGWAARDADGICFVAAGPEALVGALEMAVTLGPLDALVETVTARAEAGEVDIGFEIRR